MRQADGRGSLREPRSVLRWVDVTVKVALVSLLAFGAFSGLDRFAGKAFGWRLIGYTVAAGLVPAIWAIRGRRRPYPYMVDTLFVLPFLSTRSATRSTSTTRATGRTTRTTS